MAAEEQTIQELKSIGKPFLIVLNCKKPYSEEAQGLKQELEKKYKTTVITVNCEQLKMEDINQMMQQLLYEFPISEVEFYSQMGRNVVEGACNQTRSFESSEKNFR